MGFKLLYKVAMGLLLYSLAIGVVHATPDLVVGGVSGNPSDTVAVPIAFTNNAAGDIVAMDFKLNYDPAILTVNSVDLTALGGNVSNFADDAVNGVITFLIANFPSQTILNGNVAISFTINAGAVAGSTTTLDLQAVTFSNDVAGAVPQDSIIDGSVVINAVVVPNPATQSIPTLSQWVLMLLSFTLLFVAVPMARSKK